MPLDGFNDRCRQCTQKCKQFKQIKIIFCPIWAKSKQGGTSNKDVSTKPALISLIFLGVYLAMSFNVRPCNAELTQNSTFLKTYKNNQIANAIYKAEGGAKTRHPYGILTKYKHTTPRQACINTIKHAKRDWNGKGDFIVFLGNRYCPVGASNDPTNLNKNWVRNVKHFLEKDND